MVPLSLGSFDLDDYNRLPDLDAALSGRRLPRYCGLQPSCRACGGRAHGADGDPYVPLPWC